MLSAKSLVLGLVAAGIVNCQCPDVSSIIAHDGTPVGTEEVIDGVNMYIARPTEGGQNFNTTAIVYATDVYGIQLDQNKLLVDSFARAGFLTVAPDLFNGTPAPSDLDDPNFNSTQFIADHGPEVVEPLLDAAINYLRATAGAAHVGVTGYCFGGRYSFRLANASREVHADMAFAAHPSRLQNEETAAVGFPISVAAAETDTLLTPEQRSEMEALLQNTTVPYQVSLYSGTNHGFGVRANVSDFQQRYGKESAFLQAVRWFQVMGSSNSSGGGNSADGSTDDSSPGGSEDATSSASGGSTLRATTTTTTSSSNLWWSVVLAAIPTLGLVFFSI